MRIPLTELEKDMIIDEDVFTNQGNMLVGRGFSVSNPVILTNLLKKHGIPSVKVLVQSADIKEDEPEEPKVQLEKEIVSFKEEFKETVSEIQQEIKNIQEGPADKEVFDRILETGLDRQKNSRINIFQLLQKMKDNDDETFSHCYSVSLSAYAIGKWLELDEDRLKQLTLSAILADIGKVSIDQKILSKKLPLDEKEMQEIKKHVHYSAELTSSYDLGNELKAGVMFHHERTDGSGYPHGLTDEQIPLFARIIAIADVYIALTSNRSYRKKNTPLEAVRIMQNEYMKKLDIKILTEFFNRITQSYIGNPVTLNDGRSAEIVFISRNNLSRPVIKVDDTDGMIDLGLMENSHIDITEFV